MQQRWWGGERFAQRWTHLAADTESLEGVEAEPAAVARVPEALHELCVERPLQGTQAHQDDMLLFVWQLVPQHIMASSGHKHKHTQRHINTHITASSGHHKLITPYKHTQHGLIYTPQTVIFHTSFLCGSLILNHRSMNCVHMARTEQEKKYTELHYLELGGRCKFECKFECLCGN